MNAFDVLTNEHGLIRHFLDNLALAMEKIETGGKPPREFFEKTITFARRFADKYHHHKEELVMFTRLAQKKDGKIDAQIEVLRMQHERGRQCISEIEGCLDGFLKDDPIKTGLMLENLAVYTANLRRHIHLEDHIFFPFAKRELSEEDRRLVEDEFEKTREKFGADTFEEYHKMVVDMGSQLLHLS